MLQAHHSAAEPQPISAASPMGNDSERVLTYPYRLALRISCFTASYFCKRDYVKAEVAIISVWCDDIQTDIASEDTPARGLAPKWWAFSEEEFL